MTTRRLLSTALLLLAPLVAALAAVLLHDSVPDPLPRHWNMHGEVDGTTGFATMTTLVIVASAALAVAGVVVTWLTSNRSVAAATGMLGWLAWLFSLLYAGTLLAANGAARAEAVDLPWWNVLGVLVGSLLAWAGLHALLPPHPDRLVRTFPTMTLGDDERVVWVGSARSQVMAWLGLSFAVVGAVLVFVEPGLGLILLGTGVLLWWMHALSVRVDDRGVHVGWGPLRWPGRSYALSTIVAAEAETIEPMQWGGWGYRVSPRGTGLIVRRGEGFVLHRSGAADIAVTVDGADDAAALVNALVQRAGVGSR